MLLWLLFAVITAAVVLAVTRPLSRPRSIALDAAAADLAVYRDQLTEIEADRERGLLDGGEAEAARAEVARRLIQRAGDGKVELAGSDSSASRVRAFSIGAAAFIALGSVALYLANGFPSLPDQPHATRVAKGQGKASLNDLVAQVEARLRDKPDDGAGWDAIAPVYLLQRRYAEAADAYSRAIRLLGETPKRLQGMAETSVMAASGIVDDAARKAFEKLLALDPSRLEARYWLAVAKEQDGKLAEAAEAYRALLTAAPADAPWRPEIEARLKAVVTRADGPAPAASASAPPGAPAPAPVASSSAPPAVDPAAVEAMTPAERQAFIARMVTGLAERLKADGKDLEGWQRLVRAYKVMGKVDAAVAALADARRNFVDDPKALGQLDNLARSLGLGS
jgi:cytochrome c-type biogenesis protein CcmH